MSKVKIKDSCKLYEKMFKERAEAGSYSISEVKVHDGIKVGDWVIVKNAYDVEVGPFKVLAFKTDFKMYLNWDCFWFPIPTSRVIRKVEVE